MNAEVLEKPKTVLDPVRHARLLAEIEHISAVANISPSYIKYSMLPYASSQDIDYVSNFRLYKDTVPGLLVLGTDNIDDRCYAMCGAFIRNFIDARVITITSLLNSVENKTVPEPTVLIVPNFYISSYGKTLPAWKLAELYDVLLQRTAESKPTILAVDNPQAMKQSYGLSITNHLKKYKGQ